MSRKVVVSHRAQSNKRPRLYTMSPASRRLVLLVAQGITGALAGDRTAEKWVARLLRAAAVPAPTRKP